MIRTVKQFLGIEVNHLVEVDFEGFPEFVDAMGGVKMKRNSPPHTDCGMLTFIADEFRSRRTPFSSATVSGLQVLVPRSMCHGGRWAAEQRVSG